MFLQLLAQINQTHLINAYKSQSGQARAAFDAQLTRIQENYPGGLRGYYHNALKLLKDSAQGVNPYAQYQIGKPEGEAISFDNLELWERVEERGLKELNATAFVLVAGGLGERLGYPGIKLSIPMELLSGTIFLQYYAEYILTFQRRFSKNQDIPLAIMTSDDTHKRTVQLLEKNKYFGLKPEQVTLIKQEKVPALTNNQAHFSLVKDSLELQTKPHGHGDVHTLIYNYGLGKKWANEGRRWVVVFQDTNPFAPRSFPLLLGVAAQRKYDFTTICVPRKPGETVGAITTLVHKKTKKILTVNVQYNQLESLFNEIGGEKVNAHGYSLFPGNTNCFCLGLESYNQILDQTKGLIAEFINPKYADHTKTKFKSSTRLQCMMQDYPKLLPNCQHVGFVDIPKGYSFTTLKNDRLSANAKIIQGLSGEGAASCQSDIYQNNRKLLRLFGAQIEEGEPVEVAEGVRLPFFPLIYIAPEFATCLSQLKNKVRKLKVSGRSSLILASDSILEDVQIDGHYEIRESGSIVVRHLEKDYRSIVGLVGDEPSYLQIRGYKLKEKSE